MLHRTIQVNYDLKRPGRDYQPVYDYIKAHGTWCHLLDSLWLIRTTKTAGQVRDELTELVDSNDKIAAFDVSGVSWATNFSNKQTDWMHNQMGVASYA